MKVNGSNMQTGDTTTVAPDPVAQRLGVLEAQLVSIKDEIRKTASTYDAILRQRLSEARGQAHRAEVAAKRLEKELERVKKLAAGTLEGTE